MTTRYKWMIDQLTARTTQCLIWPFPLNADGYGRVQHNGIRDYTHRWAYMHEYGPIPENLQIDHVCRVRECFNPDHLEAITQQENIIRGESGWDNNSNAAKTHCPAGHAYTLDNTYYSQEGWRRCKTCVKGH